jgi:hypothetical protein
MASFITWASKTAGRVSKTAHEMVDSNLRHRNRTLEYLHSREIEGKTLIKIVQYIKNCWPRAFSDDVVLIKLRNIVEIRRSDWSEEYALEVYDSVTKLSDKLQTVFSHVPVLFFDKDVLFNRRYSQHYSQHMIYYEELSDYYKELSDTRKAKYAAKALAVNGDLLEFVPMSSVNATVGKTKDEIIKMLYEIAVHNSPLAIKFVPEAKRTEVMMKDAVRESAYALKYLSPKWQVYYLEYAIMNCDDWTSEFWQISDDLVISSKPWLQNIFDGVDHGVLIELYERWSIKTNNRINEQAMA